MTLKDHLSQRIVFPLYLILTAVVMVFCPYAGFCIIEDFYDSLQEKLKGEK
jgi:hypothetical protein